MPVFDLEQQRMCVRVVYDGVAATGKTTNLRHLAATFAQQKNIELVTPAEIDGRTLYFDWLQVSAGVVCGFPLICQVISVPGQMVLTPRRRHLLALADVVVYVCDSAEPELERAREGLAFLDQVLGGRDPRPPVVVQANKQDHPGALDGAALLTALDREGLPMVEAIASDGIGVVDTFVAAVRSVARSIQDLIEEKELRVEVAPAPTAAEVLHRLAEEKVDPEWEAEMLLEEACRALADEERPAVVDEVAPPVLPREDVPAGFIWPAHTGRTTLRALRESSGLRGAIALSSERYVRRYAHGHVLETSIDLRFTDVEEARQALVQAARARTRAGTDAVLVVQRADDGAYWLWTVSQKPEAA